MILSLICLTALQRATAGDFFPVVPGTVRTYEQKRTGEVLTNSIGNPIELGSMTVVPITEAAGSGSGSTTYYKVGEDDVSIAAYDIKKPMNVPMPILKVGVGKVTWDYQGSTGSGKDAERLLAHGEAHLAGQKLVLGKKIDILTVKLSAAIGIGLSGETFEQTAVYGKGIGLIELTTKTKLGKKSAEVSYHIVTFEPGK